MGCEYGCEYCYWRDEKYNRLAREHPELSDAFSQHIKIKTNAVDLLRKELKNKPRDLIYIDSYQPAENKYRLARQMLEVCLELDYPVFVNEKSPLLLNDLDLLKKLKYINVGWSIVFSSDDEAKKAFESRAPTIASRFDSMKKLSNQGLLTGTVAMPLLPYICDTEDNIKGLVKKTRDNGGKYVLDAGLTLWGYCSTHFYNYLEKYDNSLLLKYKRDYDAHGNYLKYGPTHELVSEYCKKYGLLNHIPRPYYNNDNARVAEYFYVKSRELFMTVGPGYKQFAYLRTAWLIDELTEDIKEVYEKKGRAGLLAIKGIGDKMADELVSAIAEQCQ